MGLSYTGSICFETPRVMGYNLVPEPPANTIPFIVVSPFLGAINDCHTFVHNIFDNRRSQPRRPNPDDRGTSAQSSRFPP